VRLQGLQGLQDSNSQKSKYFIFAVVGNRSYRTRNLFLLGVPKIQFRTAVLQIFFFRSRLKKIIFFLLGSIGPRECCCAAVPASRGESAADAARGCRRQRGGGGVPKAQRQGPCQRASVFFIRHPPRSHTATSGGGGVSARGTGLARGSKCFSSGPHTLLLLLLLLLR
jgi:hypothetical protein